MVNDIDKAWLAGIVEGEGSLVAWRQKSCDSLAFRLTVYNTNPLIAAESKRLLEAIIGASVRVRSIRRLKTHRVIYHVVVESKAKVAVVIRALLPFFRGKRHEAETILAIIALCPNRAGGWNRWGKRIPLSTQVDLLLSDLRRREPLPLSVGNPEPSGAGVSGSAEGATVRPVSPNNNPAHERPTSRLG